MTKRVLMPRSRLLRWCIGIVSIGLVAWGAWAWLRPQPLNVLIITLDTTRADRVGAWGGPKGLTSVLDRLAANSTIFERAYTPVPLTLPSHVSLMTGLNPPEHGIRLNSAGGRLADDVPLLAEILQRDGYATGAFIGAFVLDSKFGLDRGFDVYNDEIHDRHGAISLDSHRHPSRPGEEVVGHALEWLDEHRGERFFCWVHLFDPHTPYDAREGMFGGMFRDRPYDAGVAYADLQIGKLLLFLERQGLDANTLVIVVGDHGEALGEHNERTHGLTMYEASMHVPMIVRVPGAAANARNIRTPVSLIDLFPTVLSAVGKDNPPASSGRNLWPAMQGAEIPEQPIYIETDHPFGEAGWAPQRGLITSEWKYIRSPRPELYHLKDDPAEQNNLADDQGDRLAQMEELLVEREEQFELREADALDPTTDDERKLASLGYAGGASPRGEQLQALTDIKDRIEHYNAFSDASILFVQGRFAEAQAMLEEVVDAVPDYSEAWLYLGTSHLEQGHTDEAKQALERAVELSGDATTRIVLGKFYITQNEAEKALPHLEAAVDRAPQSTTGHYFLGEAYRLEGQHDKARRHFERTLELSPGFPLAEEALRQLSREK